MVLQYVETKRGRKKSVHGGYLFYKNKDNRAKTYWKCDKYHKTKYCAQEDVISSTNEHNHTLNVAEAEATETFENTADCKKYE